MARPFVPRPDRASRQIGSPEGISCRFQVSAHHSEPFSPSLSRNLFAKDN
jgi:hypothetical protein